MDLNNGLCAVLTRKIKCDYRKKEKESDEILTSPSAVSEETILQIVVLLTFSPFKFATGIIIILQGSNTSPEVTLLTCSSAVIKTLCSKLCNEK
jgi:hypothetical protein